MSSEDARLLDRIRQQFDARALPRVHPERTFGGWGVDDPCRGCCDPMRRGKASASLTSRRRRTASTSRATGSGRVN
jgi:hypothetical protein